jgi:thymidylate synthase
MRISFYYNSEFGKKVIGNIVNSSTFCTSCGDLCDHCRELKISHADSIVDLYEFPDDLPEFIDDPFDHIPKNVGECDLLIAMDLHPDIFSVLPEIAANAKAKAVIAPVEVPKLAPAGLVQQVKEKLESAGIDCEFPKPFCSLTKTGKTLIDEFVDMGFGRPLLRIGIDPDRRIFSHVQVLRDAPCGSTWYVAKKLRWTDIEDYKEIVSGAHHAYPCTASMDKDTQLKDTILHEAGYIIRGSVEEASGFKKE